MPAKTIGIVACSAEGAALCYRTICLEGQDRLGRDRHPAVAMHTHCLGEYMDSIHEGAWGAVAEKMIDSANRLARAGAELAVCPDNTIHQVIEKVRVASPIPWLSIAEEVAGEARRLGYRRIGVLGTRFLMEGPVYPAACEPRGLSTRIPEPADRRIVDRTIFDELVYGTVKPDSLGEFQRIIGELGRSGCDAVVLGCTEIPLLVSESTSPLPVLDSTRILARAALRESIDDSAL